ncbi:MAG: hypothetical protein PHX61_01845 [Alphaproteobacteria bacterium]|nr:hypothetical protein [Alphaproteobacteria bacterium]
MATTQATPDSSTTLDPHAVANQALIGAIRDIPENDPNKGVKIMTLFEGYFRQIGRVDLADNVNKVLKLNQEGKYDLRKNFASSAQEIWKIARTKEQDIQKKDFDSYLDSYYNVQNQKLSTELDVQGTVLKGAAGGYKIIAMIGSIMSAIPGLEDTGRGLVEYAVDASKSLKLENIENDAVHQGSRKGGKHASISDASGQNMAKEIADITGRVLSDAAVASEARASRDATGGLNPQTETFRANGEATTQPPSPKAEGADAKKTSPLCSTSFGAKLDICHQPS